MMFETILRRKSHTKVFLGSPEAEAEATAASRMPLTEVYEDFHDLLDGLSGEKFIITGRKGCGKSAFAEYVHALSLKEPTLHCDFIKKSNSNIERAVQLGQEAKLEIDSESFFRWVIYTSMLRMFTNLPAISDTKEYALLRGFLDKNSGYIKVDELEIKQLIEKSGFDVATEQFRRFISLRFNKQLEIKSERAPYYKLLPHLETTLIGLLRSNENTASDNSYVLFFDDLDIGFDASDQSSIKSVVELLRTCRYVNNDVFGKHGVKAKVVILIRDDIEAFLAGREADTAKLFSSYSSRINWYQEEYAGRLQDENALNLKRFITNRITFAFKRAGIAHGTDVWRNLIADSNEFSKSSFKYVVNQTLFRPRDLLLFFLPLDEGKFTFPLKAGDARALANRYSMVLASEIKSELSSFYTQIQIETIFRALGRITRGNPTYKQAEATVADNCKDVDSELLLNYLFDRSLIGTVNSNGWYTFKCRKSSIAGTDHSIDPRQNIVVQYGIKPYLQSRNYV